MAKLRRSAGRPPAAKKARVSTTAARSKARPAAKKPVPKTPRQAAGKASGARPAPKVKKPAPSRPAPKAGPAPGDKPGAKARPKPPAPPPRRSTYADAVVLYERGLHALQAKRYLEAADILKRVIAEFPEEIELHERAQLYIRVCERQLTPPDATPKTPDEQVYAATLAINAGQVERALTLLAAALQQQSDNDGAEYMLGVALAVKGDQAGAIAHLTRAMELNPETRELLRKEPELEALRQTDELQALLAAPPASLRRDRRAQPRIRR